MEKAMRSFLLRQSKCKHRVPIRDGKTTTLHCGIVDKACTCKNCPKRKKQ